MATKRHSKTWEQQAKYYEVDNIAEYMVETYLNGNISTYRELYRELKPAGRRLFISWLFHTELNSTEIEKMILAILETHTTMATTRENKGTRAFNDTIRAYLEERAENDALFAVKFANPTKSVDDCVTYIINQVQKSGCNGFADDEIFGMAMHYWEESEIEVGNPINCNVVVNHTVELTEEEKEQARQDAINKLRDEEMAKMRRPIQPKKATEKKVTEVQPSLFDF